MHGAVDYFQPFAQWPRYSDNIDGSLTHLISGPLRGMGMVKKLAKTFSHPRPSAVVCMAQWIVFNCSFNSGLVRTTSVNLLPNSFQGLRMGKFVVENEIGTETERNGDEGWERDASSFFLQSKHSFDPYSYYLKDT